MDKERIKVLLVEDDEDDYIMTRDLLEEIEDEDYELEWAASYDASLEMITGHRYDIYLFDYRLGGKTGLELIKEVVEKGNKTPAILLTGQSDKEVDMEAMKAGAADYLVKGKIDSQLLERSIRYAIERKKTEEQIIRMAYYDSLTQLPNRLLFQDRLKQTIEHARRYKRKAAILFLDLDNFKHINDTLEHRTGDLLLKGIAERLNDRVRKSDTVARHVSNDSDLVLARLGGDEFILLLTEISSYEDAAMVSYRILDALSRPFFLDDHEVFMTASIGIAVYPRDGEDMDSLLKNADTAMYCAKDEGRNTFQFYKQSMNATAFERLTLVNNLHKAIEREELLLHYQPQIDINTWEIVGMEALLRWQNPERGMVPPADFIPLAEETGLIIPISEWVIDTACRQNMAWQKEGLPPVRVAVNLSGQQFKHLGLLETVKKALETSSLDPRYLELEFTESVMMKNVEGTIDILHALREMGARLSMDDFGTGYSSFSYLKRFPLDVIKIDRSFVKDVTEKADDAAIASAIIAMAHVLNLKVIAEGVETEQQLAFLKEHGCDQIQGYFFSPPLPVEEIPEFFAKMKNGGVMKSPDERCTVPLQEAGSNI